jgi:hypothetical protein
VGAVEDGRVGPKTIAAVNSTDPVILYLRVLGYRFVLWADLVRRDRSQGAFIGGWNRRGVYFLEYLGEWLSRR